MEAKLVYLEKCGKLFAEVQKERELTIKEILDNLTSQKISQPAVTKFEHGNADIGFTKFHDLLNQVYMHPNEYFMLVQSKDTDFLQEFILALRHASNHDSLAELSALKERVTTTFPGSDDRGAKKLLLLCIKGMAEYIRHNDFLFDAKDTMALLKYFKPIEQKNLMTHMLTQ